MFIRFLLSLFLLVNLHFSTLLAALNISSHLIYSFTQHPNDNAHAPPFLKEVLKAIAVKQNWDLNKIRVSKLDKVRFGNSKRYTFSIKVEKKRDLVVRFSEEVDSWKRFEIEGSFEELVNEVSSKALLRSFLVEGPFVLLVNGVDDRLSLRLPRNSSCSGLKQIVVGEGITLEIKGAQQVSFSPSSCKDMLANGSYIKNNVRFSYWPLLQSFCLPLHPMRVVGSVSVTAFRRDNSGSSFQQNFVANDIVQLTAEKCYPKYMYSKPPCPINLSSRIVALQRLLRSLLGDNINEQIHSLSFHKVNMKQSTFVRFQLELDRDVGANDTQHSKLPEWRTKPTVERAWFDVVARVESENLRPVTFKTVRPFIRVDSTSWSYLFSNISLTEFSNVLVPPHPLTLDVKW